MAYKVLRKTKKTYITPNTIFYGGSAIFFIPVVIGLALGFDDSLWVNISFYAQLMLFFVSMIIRLFKFNKYKTLKGELTSALEFHPDGIQIDDTFYTLDEITKIKLEDTYDYKGRNVYSNGEFDGTLSNGVANLLVLNLNDGRIISIHFQQSREKEIIQEKENLIRYCNAGKLGLLTLLDILGITNYNEIQRFKKEYITRA